MPHFKVSYSEHHGQNNNFPFNLLSQKYSFKLTWKAKLPESPLDRCHISLKFQLFLGIYISYFWHYSPLLWLKICKKVTTSTKIYQTISHMRYVDSTAVCNFCKWEIDWDRYFTFNPKTLHTKFEGPSIHIPILFLTQSEQTLKLNPPPTRPNPTQTDPTWPDTVRPELTLDSFFLRYRLWYIAEILREYQASSTNFIQSITKMSTCNQEPQASSKAPN